MNIIPFEHSIILRKKSVVVINWETRYNTTDSQSIPATIYKKDKQNLVDKDIARDFEQSEYNVIIDGKQDISMTDIVIPNIWFWDLWEYVVTNIDVNNSLLWSINNTFFTIKAR